MSICKWCYCYDIEYAKIFTERARDLESIKWLGIKEKDICRSCQNSIVYLTEELSKTFERPYDCNGNTSGKRMKYSEIPYELRVLGWVAFLREHLKERLHSHYFKKRISKHLI